MEPEPKPVQTKLPKEKRSTSRDRSRDRSRDKSRGLNRSADSEDLLFNFSEDDGIIVSNYDGMDRINRKALLGTDSVFKDFILINARKRKLPEGIERPLRVVFNFMTHFQVNLGPNAREVTRQ